MISVIVPTLNAAERLPTFLSALEDRELFREIIISDGGSDDGTRAIAQAANVDFIVGPPGRGGQLAHGAETASNNWLLFLHVDSNLTVAATDTLKIYIGSQNARGKAAYFKFGFEGHSFKNQLWAWAVEIRCRLFGLPYGDQGLLIHRSLYDAVGGFKDIPLMEDVDIVRRLGKNRLHQLSATLMTSPEKYQRNGYGRQSWRNYRLLRAYLRGTSPQDLYQQYYGGPSS